MKCSKTAMPGTDRYEVRADGTVLDKQTGLLWESNAAVNIRGRVLWQAAMDAATTLGDDWRVPTIAELMVVIDHSRVDPVTMLPRMMSDWYWSSSSYADGASYAWHVNFHSGCTNNTNKANVYYVRCVRCGTCVPRLEPSTLPNCDADLCAAGVALHEADDAIGRLREAVAVLEDRIRRASAAVDVALTPPDAEDRP